MYTYAQSLESVKNSHDNKRWTGGHFTHSSLADKDIFYYHVCRHTGSAGGRYRDTYV